MTAPSLLDELEGVMAARAEWIESHSDTAWNELALLSVNFVSVNRTTLADMAKRLEAAPIATGSQLARGIRPGDYAVPWDWPVTSMTKVRLIAIDAAAQEGKG